MNKYVPLLEDYDTALEVKTVLSNYEPSFKYLDKDVQVQDMLTGGYSKEAWVEYHLEYDVVSEFKKDLHERHFKEYVEEFGLVFDGIIVKSDSVVFFVKY